MTLYASVITLEVKSFWRVKLCRIQGEILPRWSIISGENVILSVSIVIHLNGSQLAQVLRMEDAILLIGHWITGICHV